MWHYSPRKRRGEGREQKGRERGEGKGQALAQEELMNRGTKGRECRTGRPDLRNSGTFAARGTQKSECFLKIKNYKERENRTVWRKSSRQKSRFGFYPPATTS